MCLSAWMTLTKITRAAAVDTGNDYRWMLHRCAMLLPINAR